MSEKRNSKDIAIISMILFYPAVRGYMCALLNVVLGRLGIPMAQWLFDTICWGSILLIALPTLLSRLRTKHVLVGLGFWSLSFILFLLELSPAFSTDEMTELCLFTFPPFFVGACVRVNKNDFKFLYWIAFAVFGMLAAYQVFNILGGDQVLSDNMDYAYKILPAVVVLVGGCFYNRHKLPSVLLAVGATVFLMFQGTRGPLVCVVVFVCLMLYKKFGFGKIVVGVASLAIAAMLVISSPAFLSGLERLSQQTEKLGFSSRFITKIVEGEFGDSSGRDEIIDRLMTDFEKDPVQIRGFYADRLANAKEGRDEDIMNRYAHNILYELLYDFGLIVGGFLIVLLFLGLLRVIRGSDADSAFLVMEFIVCGFVHLLLSSSFLWSAHFFCLFGLFLNDSLRQTASAPEELPSTSVA